MNIYKEQTSKEYIYLPSNYIYIQKRNLIPNVFDLLGSWCLIGRECEERDLKWRFPQNSTPLIFSHEIIWRFCQIFCTFSGCLNRDFSLKFNHSDYHWLVLTVKKYVKSKRLHIKNRVKFPNHSRFFKVSFTLAAWLLVGVLHNFVKTQHWPAG